MIAVAALLPLTILVLYLMYVLNMSNHAFDQITNSVTYANSYESEFKERLDYSMYLAVIRGEPVSKLEEGKVTVNGIKNRRILVTRAPFEICICVRTEMDESIKGRFGQKPELICARLNMCRLRYEVLHFCPPLFKFYSTKYSRQSEPL